MRIPTLNRPIRAVVIGASAGGVRALLRLLPHLSASFIPPVLVALHMYPDSESISARLFSNRCALTVREACDKDAVEKGHIYFAPANYHLLVERDETLSLSVDERVHHSRPSIDVLFESAADAWGANLLGILLTGANRDGARGMRHIRRQGGCTIAQDPATAEYPTMPRSAIETDGAESVLSLDDITEYLRVIP